MNKASFRSQSVIKVELDTHMYLQHKSVEDTDSRLAGKYRWREFPAVITGNYRPGKYSKFWQSGKYEISELKYYSIFP